jgi:hypothetical protein
MADRIVEREASLHALERGHDLAAKEVGRPESVVRLQKVGGVA